MTQKHYDKYVPDEGPANALILLVGEAPGESEHEQGRLFVGMSGDILMGVLARNGISRGDVRLANLCHYRPYGNKFEALLGTDVLRDGIKELYSYIESHRPHVIVALGANPLKFLTGKQGIMKWRGSILSYIGDETIKVIPTVHPSAVARQRELYPTFDIDIKRAIRDSSFREKRLPVRQYVINPGGLELEEWTEKLCNAEYLGTDIETVKRSSHILCVGFAPSPEIGVCIVPSDASRRKSIERILGANNKKIFQFGTFDTTQLEFLNAYPINDRWQNRSDNEQQRPYYWDTLIAQHVIAPELPRSLEYLTSIYTREPYYKTEGRGNIPGDTKGWSDKADKNALYIYNAKDCCCTIEVFLRQREEILNDKKLRSTFDFEMSMLEVAHHISNSGMYIDEDRRALLQSIHITKWEKLQFVLDRLTGFETNVRSPKLKTILYDKANMNLPTRRNREGGITTDEDAIVSLIAYCKDKLDGLVRKDSILDWKVKLAICKTILEIRGLRQVLSNYLLPKMRNGQYRVSPDGRIRSTYKVGGTETGRWSSMKFVDGTGLNAQTLPRTPVEIADADLSIVDGNIKLLSQLEDEVDEDDEIEDEE